MSCSTHNCIGFSFILLLGFADHSWRQVIDILDTCQVPLKGNWIYIYQEKDFSPLLLSSKLRF